jgi:hypothetical protein
MLLQPIMRKEIPAMNDMPNRATFNDIADANVWRKLLALAKHVEIEEAGGAIVIRNGRAKIMLRDDGTIRIEGARIVQQAERNITLNAATIDLN